jgi:hypothetical protein
MSSAGTEKAENGLVRERGGKSPIKPEEKLGDGYKAIGILYVKQDGPDFVELKVRYESHVSDAVKVAIAERFGVGAREWKVSEGA